jgi:ferritin-like metal-binding protein YciE
VATSFPIRERTAELIECCIGFEGLKAEHDILLQETSHELVDAVDSGAAARTENDEIAAYEGLRRMAKAMGEERSVELPRRQSQGRKGRAPTGREDRDPREQ